MREIKFKVTQIIKHNKDGSFGTQAKRKQVLMHACGLLADKFPGLKLQNLKERHCSYLVETWKDLNSAKSMLSHLRWLLRKINKKHLLPASNDTLGVKRRVIISNINKSWIGKADILSKIGEVSKLDETAGLVLMLCLFFGLRLKEASLFRPHENIQEDYIDVIYGTKGSRQRRVKIRSEEQANFLRIIREKIAPGRSMVPPNRSFIEFRNNFYYTIRKCGIKREHGLNVHGLRHSYACLRYEELTGEEAPVLRDEVSKDKLSDREKHSQVREQIASELGHGRSSVTSAYVGGKRR